ncbi:MAG: glycosyltransferase [Lactimicrobium massiliense]|nr:glycosyltransferase [Lactimicrobium massiliense]MDD6559535.1 glycosyltransferase [Lactimicrobium massiliense]
MIPKIIHYCWFGRNVLPKKAVKCMNSWKKYCPDYQIIEWNEDNFDVHMNAYTEYAYENKKFAFLSDYVRLLVVYQNGGIYLDTDVEVIKPLDDLLDNHAYFGFETKEYVNTGVGFGAEKNNEIVKAMLDEYDQLLDGKHGVIGCPRLNTTALVKHGLIQNGTLQNIEGAMIYPADYFNPYDDPTGRLNKTKNTYSIHWYSKSWMDKKTVLRSELTKPIHRMFGKDVFHRGK